MGSSYSLQRAVNAVLVTVRKYVAHITDSLVFNAYTRLANTKSAALKLQKEFAMNDKSAPVSREELDSLGKKVKDLHNSSAKRFEEYKAIQARKEERRKKEEEKLKKEHDKQIASLIGQNKKLNERCRAAEEKSDNAEKVAYEALEKNAELEGEVGALKYEVSILKDIVKPAMQFITSFIGRKSEETVLKAISFRDKVRDFDKSFVDSIEHISFQSIADKFDLIEKEIKH